MTSIGLWELEPVTRNTRAHSKTRNRRRQHASYGLLSHTILGIALGAGGVIEAPVAAQSAPPVRKVDYNRTVRPILAQNCLACHGPDAAQRAKGLRLDLRES